MLPKSMLDTDTYSDLMRPASKSIVNARAYQEAHGRFSISIITRFEILRGLKAVKALSQLAAFEISCKFNEIIPVDDKVVVRAADIYADLKQRGKLIGDADILIAASDIENGLVLVTNNEKHYGRISGLQFVNWMRP